MASLTGKTILVTRARAQAASLVAELEALGATVIQCPVIEIIPPSDPAPLDNAIRDFHRYDWVVFTSINGVEFFSRRLLEQKADGIETLRLKHICAIGTATASAIENEGLRATLIASESTGEGALAAIVAHLGGAAAVRGLRFLIPRARVAQDVLPVGLRGLGAHVDAVEAYQTVAAKVEAQSIKRLFEERSVDAITFTSSSTVSNFAALLGLEDLSDLLRGTMVACIGPITTKTAGRYGLKQVVQPAVYNSHDLVESIVKAFGLPVQDRS